MFRKSLRLMSLVTACIMLTSIMASSVSAAVATLISPASKTLDGRIVDVTVSYDSESANVKIDTVCLYIDSKMYEKKKLDVPAQKGVISFDWDTASYARGQHLMEVKLFSSNKIVTSVSGTGVVSDQVFDVTAPVVKFENIKNGDVVSGKKVISITAKDDSGEAPIVSLLVDKKLKLMQNCAPYSYTWDTTAIEDGEHFVDIYAFDNDGNQSEKISYKVVVNNGSTALTAAALDTPAVSVASAPSVKTEKTSAAARNESADIKANVAADTKSGAALSAGTTANVFEKDNTAAPAQLVKAETAGVKNASAEISAEIKTSSEGVTAAAASLPVQTAAPAAKTEAVKTAAPAAKTEAVKTAASTAAVKNIAAAEMASIKVAKADNVMPAVSAPVNLDTPKEIKAELAAEPALGTPYKVAKADISSKVALATAERTNLVLPQSGKAKIRDIVNANGGVVLWDGRTKTVTAYVNNVKVEMTIGSKTIKVNGKSLKVNMIPKIQNGRTIIDVSDIKRAIEFAKENN